MTVYPAEFHRRCEQKWERRAEASRLYESARRMPWLLAIGRTLRAELDAVKQPVSERLAAVLKELERPTATSAQQLLVPGMGRQRRIVHGAAAGLPLERRSMVRMRRIEAALCGIDRVASSKAN